MGKLTNSRIQPLVSLRVDRLENITLDKMNYEFSKPFCATSKTDFGSDEKFATEPDSDFMAFQRTNKPNVKRYCVLNIFFE